MRIFSIVSQMVLLIAGFASALPVAAAVPPPTEELVMLRANPWQWVAFTNPVEAFTIDDPERYTVEFLDDATVAVGADCNRALGSYQGEGGALAITLGPMTAAACPPDSRGEQFVRLLGSAARYFFQDGHLFIDLFADGGTLELAPVATPAAADVGSDEQLLAVLGNLTYSDVVGSGPVTLSDGFATYTEPGSAGKPTVRLLDRLVVSGDLDRDGAIDAVAVLEDDADGTGRFIFLAPVLNALGDPMVRPAVMLGDRLQIATLALDGDTLSVEMIDQGPGDGACCPSLRVRESYMFRDGALAESAREDLGRVSLADLDGTRWRLAALDDGQPPLPAAIDISLNFTNGQVSGFAGCNTYSATISRYGEAPQTIRIQPMAGTANQCDDAYNDLETAFLERLSTASAWGYDAGWLAIAASTADGTSDRMLFAPVGATTASTPIVG